MNDNKDECPFCKKRFSNVSYHKENHCRQNPALTDFFKKHDKEIKNKLILNSKEDQFIDAILKTCKKFNLAFLYDDKSSSYKIVEYSNAFNKKITSCLNQ